MRPSTCQSSAGCSVLLWTASYNVQNFQNWPSKDSYGPLLLPSDGCCPRAATCLKSYWKHGICKEELPKSTAWWFWTSSTFRCILCLRILFTLLVNIFFIWPFVLAILTWYLHPQLSSFSPILSQSPRSLSEQWPHRPVLKLLLQTHPD